MKSNQLIDLVKAKAQNVIEKAETDYKTGRITQSDKKVVQSYFTTFVEDLEQTLSTITLKN